MQAILRHDSYHIYQDNIPRDRSEEEPLRSARHPDIDTHDRELIAKDQNCLKEDIVFKGKSSGKVVELFQGATIIGTETKEYGGNFQQYVKILNTNPNSNSSNICFIAKVDNNSFHYYQDQKSFKDGYKGAILISKNNHTAFRQLLRFYSEIDFRAINKDDLRLSAQSFKNETEVEYCNDISKFSGYIHDDIRNERENEIVLNQNSFCDGTYVKIKSEYISSEKEVIFFNIRSEDDMQNVCVRISPIGTPIETYLVIYRITGQNFKKFESNSEIIQLLYKYQLAMEKAIISTQRRIDIPRKENIIKSPVQEITTNKTKLPETSFWQKLSKTEKITTVLMTLIAVSAILLTVLAFFIQSITKFIVTIIGVNAITSAVAPFTFLLPLILIIFYFYSFYRKHKDSKVDSANNRVTKHILSRLGLSSGAITVLGLIIVKAIFPQALIIVVMFGFVTTASSLLAAWVLKRKDNDTPPIVVKKANEGISTSKNNILLVIEALSFILVIAHCFGKILFASTIVTNPTFFIVGMFIFILTFMYRNWQRNIDFAKKRDNISASISALADIANEDGIISKAVLKESYLAYKEYLCDRYDNRFFQIIFSGITAVGMNTIVFSMSLPLGLFIPIVFTILGFVVIVVSLLNYSIMTKQCQIARKPLDCIQDERKRTQLKEVEDIKIRYATISQVFNISIAIGISAIILLNTVVSVSIAISFILLAFLVILLILNIWLKYREYNLVSEKTTGLWTTAIQTHSNQTTYNESTDKTRLIDISADLANIDPKSNIYNMNSSYADLIANNKKVHMLYDERKKRVLFYTPHLDEFLRDDQGNPVNEHTNLNNVDIKIEGKFKNVNLDAPSLADYKHYNIPHGALLLVKDNKIFGIMNQNGEYFLYTKPHPRVTNLIEQRYNHQLVNAVNHFRPRILSKLNAEREFTKFMIEKMSTERTREKYNKLYLKVMPLYSKFLTDSDTYIDKGSDVWNDKDDYLEDYRDEFLNSAIDGITEEDNEFTKKIEALATSTFEYLNNYESDWLNRKVASINLLPPKATTQKPYKLKESRSDPIKDNNGEKYKLTLDTKKADIKAIVSQPLRTIIPELPANKLYSPRFMGDHAKDQEKLRMDISKYTTIMNNQEQEIIEIIFSSMIDIASADDPEYEELLLKAKSIYAKVKKAYASYCSEILNWYNSEGSEEQLTEIINRYYQTNAYSVLIGDQYLIPPFQKLIEKTKLYYTAQAELRKLNTKVLNEKTNWEIEKEDKDALIIKAEKIDFAKMPSLKAEEMRVDLILDYVASSNKGIFTRINIAALFIPLLTAVVLFLVGTIINVALPIVLATIFASSLITISTITCSKISFHISTIYTNGLEYIDIEHIDQTSFLNRVIRAIFSDYEEYTEDGKTKMQTRTILNIASFMILGVGGVTLLVLGIFVSWGLLPVGIALLFIQIPIAFMKIYGNTRIDDLGFANPQSKFLTLLPVIISTLAAVTVIVVTILVTLTTIGPLLSAMSGTVAFAILAMALGAQSIHKYSYNKSSPIKHNAIEKKFKRAVIISSIISALGASAGFFWLLFGGLSVGFLPILVALLLLFISSCSYLLYKSKKNSKGYESIPKEAQEFNMGDLTDSFVDLREE